MPSLKEKFEDLVKKGRMHETKTLPFNTSEVAKLSPAQASKIHDITWFDEGKKHRIKLNNQRQKAHDKRMKEAQPYFKLKEDLKIDIDQKVKAIRHLNPEDVPSVGIRLGFEILGLAEESNKVNHVLKELGFGYNLIDKIPSDTSRMLLYIQRIRNNQIFRKAKAK